jgi:hypothetical protein
MLDQGGNQVRAYIWAKLPGSCLHLPLDPEMQDMNEVRRGLIAHMYTYSLGNKI